MAPWGLGEREADRRPAGGRDGGREGGISGTTKGSWRLERASPHSPSTDTSSEHGKTEHQPGVPAAVCREGGWATSRPELPPGCNFAARLLPPQPAAQGHRLRASERASERARSLERRNQRAGLGWGGPRGCVSFPPTGAPARPSRSSVTAVSFLLFTSVFSILITRFITLAWRNPVKNNGDEDPTTQ